LLRTRLHRSGVAAGDALAGPADAGPPCGAPSGVIKQGKRTERGLDDLELATCEWVHWYNIHRLHGSIGHVPPIEYENEYYRQISDQSIAHELV
jgi:putative transposase